VTYKVILTSRARRDLEVSLPAAAGAAVMEFVRGPLAENPHRAGKALRAPRLGQYSARRGEYRVIYSINQEAIVVTVITMRHRRDAYRP
jgi:mRNA interferase RelE/StbE